MVSLASAEIVVRFEELSSNVLMFIGDDCESVAAAFLSTFALDTAIASRGCA